jgi:hypothetical protein
LPATESFITRIFVSKLKAPSTDKSDIVLKLHDPHTGVESIVGYSIKSGLGSPTTLLNASQATNFVFAVEGMDLSQVDKINEIKTNNKVKDRMREIISCGGNLRFKNMESKTFSDNLTMIDSQMPLIVANMLTAYYSGINAECSALTDFVIKNDPLERKPEFYKNNVKELLAGTALGMKPKTAWDGSYEATGGYIIVKTNGDVLAYPSKDRDCFRDYLFDNTRFETSSTSRNCFASLYTENDDLHIKLNLQIRTPNNGQTHPLFDNTRFETSGATRNCFASLYKEEGDLHIKLNLQIRTPNNGRTHP